MAQTSIPVDLFNPGQVFACMGLLEAADILLGNAEGRFDWESGNETFIVRADGNEHPVGAALSFLKSAAVKWLSPCLDLKERDGGDTKVLPGISASGDPKAPDLPGFLRGRLGSAGFKIPFGFWADGSGRFAITFKKSTNGASSYVRFQNALNAIKELNTAQAVLDPFGQEARTESLFRLDPRGMIDPIHGGFSPDILRKGQRGGLDIRVATYPMCELLAVLGLEHARPKRLAANLFGYWVWGCMLPPMLARAALGGNLGFGGIRRFVVEHEETKKGGDRKMNHVKEELEDGQQNNGSDGQVGYGS